MRASGRSIAVGAGVVAAVAMMAAAGLALRSASSARVLAAYSTSLEGRTPEQLANIRRAARLLNGSLVLPGQEFSLSRTFGPTTPDSGWERAPAFVGGEVEVAVAGGICQVSSTLYNAALMAGMTVTERHAHSRPVMSVPPGRDATVAWGIADLRFQNRRPGPVTILARAEGRRLTVSISGPGEMPPRVSLSVRTSTVGDRIVASVWKQEEGRSGRTLVSTDEYRASR